MRLPYVDVTLERLGGLVGGGRRVGERDGLRAEVVEVAVLAEEERFRGRRVELLAAHDEVRGEVRAAVFGRISAAGQDRHQLQFLGLLFLGLPALLSLHS